MTALAISMLVVAAALRLRLVRIWLALWLFRTAKVLKLAGLRALENIEREGRP